MGARGPGSAFDEHFPAMRARRADGVSVPAIAAEFGCSESTAYIACKGMGKPMKERRILTEKERATIRDMRGSGIFAAVVAERFGCSRDAVHAIWQGKKGGAIARPVKRITAEHREAIVAMRAAGKKSREIIEITGFSECTIRLVMRDARDDGDMRAHPDPVIRRNAAIQREAARAAHREGGSTIPVKQAALAPNSIELSLIMRGIPPEAAVEAARAFRARHNRTMASGRP